MCEKMAAGAIDALAKKLVALLAAAIEGDAEYHLSSRKLLGRLNAVENAARLLLDEIPDPQFRALLVDSSEWMASEHDGFALLRDIAARAAEAQERNPRSPGPGRPIRVRSVSGRPSALEICALMAGIVWRWQYGRRPGQKNSAAQRLCEQLWTAAGGTRHGNIARAGALTAWRTHLVAARQYEAPQPWGAMLARIMAESMKPKRAPPPRGLRAYWTYSRRRGNT
jgi:hypothetical protein